MILRSKGCARGVSGVFSKSTADATRTRGRALPRTHMSHILTFFHHMAFFSVLADFWNFLALWFRASVLSTRSSIFSPRAST